MSYIYKITNQINGKLYIGKTNSSIKERFNQHISDSKKKDIQNRPLYKAMSKYGIENFSIEQIEECSPDIVNERETYWIEYYGSFKNGYNATIGGDGRHYLDYDLIVKTYQEIQNIVKTALVCNIDPSTVEYILKNYNIQTLSNKEIMKKEYGQAVAMKDKQTLEILKTFASFTEAGQYLIDNSLSNCKLGTIKTHISEVCRGKRKSAAGFTWERIGEEKELPHQNSKIEMRDKDNHDILYQTFNSAKEASNYLFGEPNKKGITDCAKGIQKSAYGYFWKWVD